MTPEEIAADAAQKKADAEALKKQIEELKSKGAKIFSDEEMKEAIARRQEALEKARVLEEKESKLEAQRKKEEEDKLRKDGETKTLLDRKEQELAQAQERMKTLEEKASKADEADRVLREQTLAKITDPDLKKVAAELSTPSLLSFAERVLGGKITPATDKRELGNNKEGFFTPEEVRAMTQDQVQANLEKVNKSIASWT